jgi:hypothetical protein
MRSVLVRHAVRQRPAVTAALILAIVVVGTAVASAPGEPLRLGMTNSISAATTLTGSLANRMLTVNNSSLEAGARALIASARGTAATILATNAGTGPALQLQVAAGRPPLTVNASAGKATNLNADRLDGIDSSGFLPAGGKADDADQLDGIDSSGFLPVAGKANDADQLDGMDSAAFAQAIGGPSKVATTFRAMGAGCCTDHNDLGWLRLTYSCPGFPLTSNGNLRIQNKSSSAGTFLIDNGGLDPAYYQLAADGFVDVATSRTGELITIQAQAFASVATVWSTSIHRPGDFGGEICDWRAQGLFLN